MKIISHRGNINGPQPERENQPSYIDEAIALGFDVEIDVRHIGPLPGALPGIGGAFYLGHDTPDPPVSLNWLLERRRNLWVHCKNLEAAYWLGDTDLRCFCSISDPFCFITQGYLWANDLTHLRDNCIIPLLTLHKLNNFGDYDKVFGVCTDYPMEIK